MNAKKLLPRLFSILLKILAGLMVFIAILTLAGYFIINQHTGSIISSGERRTYILHVPANYDPATPTPLVITIHGFAQWPANQMDVSQWNEVADENGFIVVYPAGTEFPRRWRAGGFPLNGVDPMVDVVFINDLIDSLSEEYNIDQNRIFANGLSNGGGMTFLLSCQLSNRIAAAGSVAGAYGLPWEECNPERLVPTIVFHGDADPIVPFHGGEPDGPSTRLPDIPEWVATLADRHVCNSEPTVSEVSENVTHSIYTDCTADVQLYVIHGGGHTWPGGGSLPEWLTGLTTQEIDASQLMWEFFSAHPLAAD